MEDVFTTEDNYETRKRGREEHELVQYPKRTNFGTKPGHYLLKLLVPPTVAGSIIGRGGTQIKELQITYDVMIKLSQNNQYYPEANKVSNERIVLVTGAPDKLVQVAEFIHTLVRNPPQGPRDHSEVLDTGRRLQQMKMVVTNTTAGMIIGKRGETVRSLNEQYDVRIQASQKDDLVMGERIISILGGEDGVNKVMEYIIKEKFREDPTSSSITNLDYSAYMDPSMMGSMGNGMAGSTASLNYGGFDGGQDFNQVSLIQSLLQNQQQQSGQSQIQQQAHYPTDDYTQAQSYNNYQNSSAYSSAGATGNSYSTTQAGMQGSATQQSGAQQTSQSGGNNNTAEVIARVLQALPNNALNNTNTNTLASTLMIIQALSGNNSGGGGGSGGMSQMPRGQMGNQMQSRQSLRPFIPRPDDVKFKVEIPDSLVGRILGRQGSTITELQNSSGCEIKFSQRGEYVPGTQNRLLYICGQAASCKTAQSLILSKIEGETGDVSSSDFVFEQISA